MSEIDSLIYDSFLSEIDIVLSCENENFDENPSLLLYFLRRNIWKKLTSQIVHMQAKLS